MSARSKTGNKLLGEWLWIDRWTGSSAFLLRLEERGLYREMLTQAWRRGCRLPNDHEAIRRAVGCTLPEWRRAWPKIERYWRVDGDALVNDTQLKVYAEAKAAYVAASERGIKGARARWVKPEQNASSAQADAQASADAKAQAAPVQSPPSLSLTSRPSGERRARGAGNRGGVGAGSFPGDHLDHAACGPVCFTPRMTAKFIGRFGHDRDRLTTWAREVCDREHKRIDAGGPPPAYGDDFDYWTAAYNADFGERRGGDDRRQGERRVEDAGETDEYLADIRRHREAVLRG